MRSTSGEAKRFYSADRGGKGNPEICVEVEYIVNMERRPPPKSPVTLSPEALETVKELSHAEAPLTDRVGGIRDFVEQEVKEKLKGMFRAEGAVIEIKAIDAIHDQIRVQFLAPPGFEGAVTVVDRFYEAIAPLPPPLVPIVAEINRTRPHGLRVGSKVEVLQT
jgi:hypothetical protein